MKMISRLLTGNPRTTLPTMLVLVAVGTTWYYTIYKRIKSTTQALHTAADQIKHQAAHAPSQTTLAEIELSIQKQKNTTTTACTLVHCAAQANKHGVNLVQGQMLQALTAHPTITLQLQAKYKSLQTFFDELLKQTSTTLVSFDLTHESTGLFTLNCTLEQRKNTL